LRSGTSNYTYDSQGRVLTEDDGSGQNALSYAYYASSSAVTDALGRVTLYQYVSLNGLKKPLSVTDPAGNVTSYTYDANLNLASMTDPLGRTTRYTYDSNGNVTVTQDAANGLTRASYEPMTSPRLTRPI
jgi:YD repeat-containing protein